MYTVRADSKRRLLASARVPMCAARGMISHAHGPGRGPLLLPLADIGQCIAEGHDAGATRGEGWPAAPQGKDGLGQQLDRPLRSQQTTLTQLAIRTTSLTSAHRHCIDKTQPVAVADNL